MTRKRKCSKLEDVSSGPLSLAQLFESIETPEHGGAQGPWESIVARLATEEGKKEAQSSQEDDENPRYLRKAIFKECPDNVILALIDAYPEAAAEILSDSFKALPIHLACCRPNSSPIVLRRLIEVYPQGIKECVHYSSGDRWTPVQLLCSLCCDHPILDRLRVLNQFHPDGIKRRDAQQRLPIHHACMVRKSKITHELIHELLEVYPEGARHRDESGYLPIHYACLAKEPDVCVVRLLVEVYPECVKESIYRDLEDNSFGRQSSWIIHETPLQLLLSSEDCYTKGGVIRYVAIKTYAHPSQKDHDIGKVDDSLVLHNTILGGIPPKTFYQLVGLFPREVDAIDKRGRTILHCALVANGPQRPSPEMIDYILDICPSLASIPYPITSVGGRGQITYPFHAACLILPFSKLVESPHENEADPLKKAETNRISVQILYKLLKDDPATKLLTTDYDESSVHNGGA